MNEGAVSIEIEIESGSEMHLMDWISALRMNPQSDQSTQASTFEENESYGWQR
jgi:hypothetical protein